MHKKILLTIPNFKTAGSQFVLLALYHQYKKVQPETFILIEDVNEYFPDEVAQNDRLVIPKKGYLNFFDGISYSLKLAKLLKLNKIGVLHSWDYRSEIWEALACKIAGVPYVYTKKNNSWSKKWKLKSLLSKHIAYDHPEMGNRFFNQNAFRNKASLIVHGIDPTVFKPSESKKRRTNIIGCVGNIGYNKNQLVILKALTLCELNIQCHFYGNADETYLKEMQQFISDHNLTNQIEFKGYVPNSGLMKVLNDFDILILPSFNEGLPVILLEAIACGVYCIASDSGGGSRYILDNCGNGDIFKPEDATALSGLINQFYTAPAINSEAVENAIVQVGCKFSIRTEAEKYLKLFDQL